MAFQGISTGTGPNSGTGDTLLSGAVKINSNFTELYGALGLDGSGEATIEPDGVVTGILTVTGSTTLGNTLGDTLTVSGDINAGGTITAPIFDGTATTLANAANITTGTINVNRLGSSGTRNSSTFLRGDNVWAVVDATKLLDTNGTTRAQATTSGVSVTGALSISSNTTVSGSLTVNGNATIGNSTSDDVAINARITTSLIPNSDNTYDLGASTIQWRNLYIDGTAQIDTLTVDLNATIAGTLNANGAVNLGNATSDTITASGRFDSSLVPSSDNSYDLGASSLEWRNLYIDGTANIDTLAANAGTVNGSTIVTGAGSGLSKSGSSLNIDISSLNSI